MLQASSDWHLKGRRRLGWRSEASSPSLRPLTERLQGQSKPSTDSTSHRHCLSRWRELCHRRVANQQTKQMHNNLHNLQVPKSSAPKALNKIASSLPLLNCSSLTAATNANPTIRSISSPIIKQPRLSKLTRSRTGWHRRSVPRPRPRRPARRAQS